jgi:N-acetylmuramoyl-L-alanine amidase
VRPRCGLAALGLALGCAPRLTPARLSEALSACPQRLEDAALRELSLYERCPLPEPLTQRVRNDYADDELGEPDFAPFVALAGRVPREKFEYQLGEFVNPDGSLSGWYALQSGGLLPDPLLAPSLQVSFAASSGPPPAPGAGRLQEPVAKDRAFRPERQVELRKEAAGLGLPLAGVRVLIDPGHTGGRFAEFEKRRFEWRQGRDAPIVIQEGDLTLKTALELAAKLSARGARVELTRMGPEPGHALDLTAFRPFADRLLRHLAMDEGFAEAREGLAPQARTRLEVAAALFAVRKQFVFESLRERMRRGAAFEPDLIVSLHFNAGPWQGVGRGPQELVAMVRGNYEAGRLYNPSYRARALADGLAIDEFNASAHLGASCLRAMSRALGIPIARENRYRDHAPIRTAAGELSGVAAWNGALLRYATAPAVLLEGPFMNERDEIPRLREALDAPLGAAGTRTDQYAEGVAQGIEAWARRWLAQTRNDFGPEL